ncbi:MAG: S8 family peptidase [Rhodomicrobium sp.]
MPPRDHLPLLRLKEERPRRRRPGFGIAVERDIGAHGQRISRELDAVTAAQAARPNIPGIAPELILKVELTRPIDEDDWRRAGLTVIAQNPGNVLVLFADNRELRAFRERLAAFQGGPQDGAQSAPYAGLIGNIEKAAEVAPADRIGPRLQAYGVGDLADIDGRKLYVVDVELWDAGNAVDRRLRVLAIAAYFDGLGAERIGEPFISDHGLLLLRVRARGGVLKSIMQRPEVALVDLPPIPDLGERDPPSITLLDLPPLTAPPAHAPLIGVIDSGVNAHPLLDGVLVEQFGIPAALGTADEWGHGTKVAGIAAYGDLRERIDTRSFAAPVRVISVRVINARGTFDDDTTLPNQMRQAITLLAEKGCRIINMSLGDKSLAPYADGRASAWAGELDTLAREHDVMIVVPAGNAASGANAPWGNSNDAILKAYPAYLTTPQNRLIDPAIAANVVTVGALAHGNGLRDDPDDGVQVQAVTSAEEPSPITRTGPGIGQAIKPDFCDFGGTLVFNGFTDRLLRGQHWSSAGMLTLEPDYRRSLFTAATGTSYAAPRVAYKAALIAARLPNSSANMIRALLAIASDIPPATRRRLEPAARPNDAPGLIVRQCVGYGVPQAARALASEERRVILLADRQELGIDQVALYAIPLPEDFRSTKGKRTIRIALAFDPPVRHTRLEYLGTRMSFHLMRGMTPNEILEFFRRREDGTKPPVIPNTAKCDLDPGIEARQSSTLQCATFTQSQNTDRYGDAFYLAVFTHRRWAGDEVARQRFAVAVELAHEGCQALYQSCSALNLELRTRLRLDA